MTDLVKAIKPLLDEVAELRKEVARLQRGAATTKMQDTSLQSSAINFYDDEGNLVQSVGLQEDGTYGTTHVSGPIPSKPTTPEVATAQLGLKVTWDGALLDDDGEEIAPPADFERLDIYVSESPAFDLEDGTNVASLMVGSDLIITPLAETPHYVRFVAVSKAGEQSEPSDAAGPFTPDEVVATDIVDGIVTTLKLADNAVKAAKIEAGAVTETKIANDSVSTLKLIAGAVSADKLAADSVTAGKIAAGAVTTAKLDALAVTSDKIAANAIIAGKIAAGAITADKLDANAITGKTITGGTINGTNINGANIAGGGVLLYNGTPAAGNLFMSIAPASGTDTFGNAYARGVTTYVSGVNTTQLDPNNSSFRVGPSSAAHFLIEPDPGNPSFKSYGNTGLLTTNMNGSSGNTTYMSNSELKFIRVDMTDGQLQFGNLGVAGRFPTTDELTNVSNIHGDVGLLSIHSGTYDHTDTTMEGAAIGVMEGFANTDTTEGGPQIDMLGSGGSHCILNLRGAARFIEPTMGAPESWNAPTPNTGWALTNTFNGVAGFHALRYRRDIEDNVWLYGCVRANNTGTIPVTIFTLPTGYRPTTGRAQISCNYYDASAGTVAVRYMDITTLGQVATTNTVLGVTASNNDILFFNGSFPIGNLT